MSKKQSPFPTKDAEFNEYVQSAEPLIYSDYTRLKIDVNDANALHTLKVAPNWDTIYPKSQDPTKRTPSITAQKNTLRGQLKTQFRKIFDDIPDSVLTEDDRKILHLPKRDTVLTPRPKIETSPYAEIRSLNGALIRVRCRVETDSTRASMHPDADEVEIRAQIGGTAPTSPNKLPLTFTSKKALVKIQLGIDDAGKKIYLYVRWKNASDESKSSPWTKLLTAVISD